VSVAKGRRSPAQVLETVTVEKTARYNSIVGWGYCGKAVRKIYVEGFPTTMHLGREIWCSTSVGTFYWEIEAFVLASQIRFEGCKLDDWCYPLGSR
jgi:hypothetical protein